MRNLEETIGNLIDKQRIRFISTVDETGNPNTKAMLAPVREKTFHHFDIIFITPCK